MSVRGHQASLWIPTDTLAPGATAIGIGEVVLMVGGPRADTERVHLRFFSWHPPVRHVVTPARGGARRRGERGVSILEAAFVTPVFFTLLLGIVEIGLYMNDYLAAANTVRAGARVASSAGNDPYADYAIVQAINRESAAIPRNQIKYVVVYKADGFGAPPNPTCKLGTRTTNYCNVYTPTDLVKDKSRWGCQAGEALDDAWCPINRKVSSTGTGSEYVGVYIKVSHPWVTKMFGSQKDISDTSVIRLEPREF